MLLRCKRRRGEGRRSIEPGWKRTDSATIATNATRLLAGIGAKEGFSHDIHVRRAAEPTRSADPPERKMICLSMTMTAGRSSAGGTRACPALPRRVARGSPPSCERRVVETIIEVVVWRRRLIRSRPSTSPEDTDYGSAGKMDAPAVAISLQRSRKLPPGCG